MTRYALVLAVLITALAHSASADVFNLDATERGWVCSGCVGTTNNAADPSNDYAAGSDHPSSGPQQFRDWFEFAIPTLTGGSLVSATLELRDRFHLGGSLTYAVYGLSTQPSVFSEVITSTAYGSVGTTNSSQGTTVDITLNAAALSDIGAAQGGNIFIGGIDSGENASTNSFDFGSTNGVTNGVPGSRSILNLETAESAVPEPSSWVLFAAVLAATGWMARRRLAGVR